MKKKLLALVLTLAMALSLAACGGGDAPAGSEGGDASAETQEPAASGSSDTSGEKKVFEVGISQFVTHDALDAATQGFIDAMNDKLGEDGWKYDLHGQRHPGCPGRRHRHRRHPHSWHLRHGVRRGLQH